jgi:subtilisin family serine protease
MAKNLNTVLGAEAEEEKASSHARNQWYFYSTDSADTCANADISILDAWKITRGIPEITIAFLDTEIESEYQNRGHGAQCARVASGEFGVAPGCSSLLVKISLQSSDKDLIRIFKDTSKRADIICCSWAAAPVYRPLSSTLHKSISEIAHVGGPQKKGCVICFAAGNYNAPVKDLQNKEFVWLDESIDHIRVTKGPIENGFASHADVITVAACTSLNKKADYSNWGAEVDLCAPSNNFHPFSKLFNVEGRRHLFTVAKRDGYSAFGGTSASTALVAGVAALVKSANQKLTGRQIKEILQQTSDKIENATCERSIEETRYPDGKSKWIGYGKVNAGNAVALATTFH